MFPGKHCGAAGRRGGIVARGTLGSPVLGDPSYLRVRSRHPGSAPPQSTPRDNAAPPTRWGWLFPGKHFRTQGTDIAVE
jgi:hypothetical protein